MSLPIEPGEKEPTAHLRWFPLDGGSCLQQLWTDGVHHDWRPVPSFQIPQVVA